MHQDDLKKTASSIRQRVIELSHSAGTPHLGSSLSCVDILTTLYWSVLRIDTRKADDPQRDRFVLSKGHAALALYAAMRHVGLLDERSFRT